MDMKQHITVEQFNQLDSIQQERLWQWLLQQEYAFKKGTKWMFICDGDCEYPECNIATPLVSIGQLIELLNAVIGVFITCTDDPHPGALYWMIVLANNSTKDVKKFEAVELCDALWDAAKYVMTL